MNNLVLKNSKKSPWKLTRTSLSRFLGWLDGTEDSDGRVYLEMRQRLVRYFDRKNCLDPDDLADEVLNRVARRLEEEGSIESETPAKYCYTMARYVFMESLRSPRGKMVPLDRLSWGQTGTGQAVFGEPDEAAVKERMMTCLEGCAGKLEDGSRKMIFGYYVGTERVKIENRRNLARTLGISINALSIRACRVRSKLQACVQKCVGSV